MSNGSGGARAPHIEKSVVAEGSGTKLSGVIRTLSAAEKRALRLAVEISKDSIHPDSVTVARWRSRASTIDSLHAKGLLIFSTHRSLYHLTDEAIAIGSALSRNPLTSADTGVSTQSQPGA